MASPALRDTTITLAPGVPETLAFRFVAGKNLGDSKFPPFLPRVVFTTVDGRALYLDSELADDLERGLRDAGIDPKRGDFACVTLIKHPKGGGSSIRVSRAEDEDAPDTREPAESKTERELRASLAAIEASKREKAGALTPASVVQQPIQQTVTSKEGANGYEPVRSVPNGPTDPAAKGTMTRLLAGALIASIDAHMIAADYARSKGIAVEIRIVFDAESVRCSANAMLIEFWKGARS
jgi:hypothetical protein